MFLYVISFCSIFPDGLRCNSKMSEVTYSTEAICVEHKDYALSVLKVATPSLGGRLIWANDDCYHIGSKT